MRGGGSQSLTNFAMRFPCESVSLAAPPKRSWPEVGHATSERRERPAFGWDRIVGEVASHYLAQPLSLFGYRLVHSTLQLYLDVLQLTPHAVASGLPLKHNIAPADFAFRQVNNVGTRIYNGLSR
jgi:hypothetical protein